MEAIMRISARNTLKGKIVSIKKGTVMAQITVDIGGGNKVSSAIFVDSVDELALKVGDEVAAVIKSTDVMIARS
jgi:molybdopterin-binding protein